MLALALALLITKARSTKDATSTDDSPRNTSVGSVGKGADGEDQVNIQHAQARTSIENLLMVSSTSPSTRVSVHAPAHGESYGNLFTIKIFSINIGQDFQK